MNDKCNCYDPECCPVDCNEKPRKCGICHKIIPYLDNDEPNSYAIYSAEAWCDDFERLDFKMIICIDCFEKLKKIIVDINELAKELSKFSSFKELYESKKIEKDDNQCVE